VIAAGDVDEHGKCFSAQRRDGRTRIRGNRNVGAKFNARNLATRG
jgi:hypothetical protein